MKFSSPLVSVGRGKVGDIVLISGSGTNLIARGYVVPDDPASAYQIHFRNAMTTASAAWQSLSDEQRQGWEDYAASLVYANPVGRYKITGRNAFLAVKQFREYMINLGLSVNAMAGNPPILPGWLDVNIKANLDPVSGQTGIRIRLENRSSEAIYGFNTLSPAVSEDVNYYKGPWVPSKWRRFICAANSVVSLNCYSLVQDDWYFAYIRAQSQSDPIRNSNTYILKFQAVATP